MSETAIRHPEIDKPKRLQIRGKLKATLDAMVWDGLEWQEAAKTHNFHVVSMRKAMGSPHVQAYIRAERQVLRESLSPRNIHRLREIRDAADNMPAIQAIRTLEQMSDEQSHGQSGASVSPGITIRIINQAPTPPTIDVTPERS